MNIRKPNALSIAAALVAALGLAIPAAAQQILLDRPVKAGSLTLFPDLADAKSFYYVVDKPKLARDADGRPQFSFLRYVENVRSGAGETEAREGEGGGIVHAVVELGVSAEQVRAAERDLQRAVAGAKVVGPVVFRSGRVGLVSSFTDTKGNLTKQVVGLGPAPLLDGGKAAVSIQLTKLGSKVLWESFKTAAPDISFSFEMDIGGYRAPRRATIEADFDRMYTHKTFGAAVASRYLSGEIQSAFDELRTSGAIRITQVGADDKMDAIITTAYNKIAEQMFAPVTETGSPGLPIGGVSAGGSLLDRATAMLAHNRAEAMSANQQIRAENARIREENRKAATAGATATAAIASSPSPAANDGAPSKAVPAKGEASPTGESGIRPGIARKHPNPLAEEEWGAPMAIEAAPRAAATAAATPPVAAPPPTPALQEEAVPEFAMLATYEMKTVRQRGVFRMDLNKHTADHLTLRFDENIGDLRTLMDDASHFRQVNLDDPLFRQRELVVFVDGLDAKDFGEYVNFAAVNMRKRHLAGSESSDEVRIDRNNFNREGNQFKLMYGWNGDDDRRKWLDYEYQTTWSFMGGKQVQEPWKKANAGALALAPPFRRRSVDLQADADAITSAAVRSVSVRIFYKLGDTEQTKQSTLNVGRGQLSARIDFISPPDMQDYEYEITWQLTGNRTVSSGRKRGNQSILFVDELPSKKG